MLNFCIHFVARANVGEMRCDDVKEDAADEERYKGKARLEFQ